MCGGYVGGSRDLARGRDGSISTQDDSRFEISISLHFSLCCILRDWVGKGRVTSVAVCDY